MDDRSRPNDWNIRPHAHADLNHVFLISEGAGVIRAEGETIAFTAPCLLLIPAGVVHGFVYEPDSAGSVLTIADSYLRELVAREPGFGACSALPANCRCRVTPGCPRCWRGSGESWSGPRRGALLRWRGSC